MAAATTWAGESARAEARRLRRLRRRCLGVGAIVLCAAATVVDLGRHAHLAQGALADVPDVLAAGLTAGAFVLGLVGSRLDPARWERGATGERETAAALARLHRRRWAVWHDLRVPGSRANIDHLVVGRSGVWVVDTKTTRSAVTTGWWRGVRFGDRRLDATATVWAAAVVADRLEAELGREVPVRPIIAVHGAPPGWRGGRTDGVRVVPAGDLTRRLCRRGRRLGRSERAVVAEAVVAAFGAEPE